ncbi:Ada metal-binding domain-containing protein [Flagellimonas meishanensis]|uniref:Ada metal-binding domain-containing protein n=1 Tax=Flagellimonas meishanensis TaxID=2873264 RepID=UPI0028BEB2A9|nr:Ada metal-binding domain-containing protein [[Muricauda] meishanensis]
MTPPASVMVLHSEISATSLFKALRDNEIKWAGNRKLKIYGTLRCKSGKRMKMENRMLFNSEEEAIQQGYRPCGHCMQKAYAKWKKDAFK